VVEKRDALTSVEEWSSSRNLKHTVCRKLRMTITLQGWVGLSICPSRPTRWAVNCKKACRMTLVRVSPGDFTQQTHRVTVRWNTSHENLQNHACSTCPSQTYQIGNKRYLLYGKSQGLYPANTSSYRAMKYFTWELAESCLLDLSQPTYQVGILKYMRTCWIVLVESCLLGQVPETCPSIHSNEIPNMRTCRIMLARLV